MLMNTTDVLLFEQADGIATITINRPEVRNAFTVEMWRRLRQLAEEIQANGEARVVILQGAGGQAFTAGSDIRELATMTVDEVNQNLHVVEDAISAIENLPVPTIACLNGYAIGGGLELALGCDLRVASEQAQMGIPVSKLGVAISHRFARRLVELVGPSRAKDLLYTGRLVDAREAHAMGLVNYLAPADRLNEAVRDLARRIAQHSGTALRAAKEAVAICLPENDDVVSQGERVDPVDFTEGIRAWLEKRAPRFQAEAGGGR